MFLINNGRFFQEKESLQLHRYQKLEINSLMAESIKNKFSKINCRESFSWKNEQCLGESIGLKFIPSKSELFRVIPNQSEKPFRNSFDEKRPKSNST